MTFRKILNTSLISTLGLLVAGMGSADFDFKDYRQLLPRGGISAITQPHYVTADEADIDDNSYVLGVVIDGKARAYSLNILNHHEVVNDRIGQQTFAAVW